jgi:hypothetical protein
MVEEEDNENMEVTEGVGPEDLSQVLSNQPDQSKKHDGVMELVEDRRNTSRP